MKSIKNSTFTLLLCFLFSMLSQDMHALTNISSHQSIHEKSSLKNQIQSTTSKIANWVKRKFIQAKDEFAKNKIMLFFVICLLVTASMLLTGLFIFLGAILTVGGGGILGGVLIGAGLFVPIIILFFSFRRILKNHFKKIGKEIERRKLNLYAILFSILPMVLLLLL